MAEFAYVRIVAVAILAFELLMTTAHAQTPQRGGTVTFATENEPANLDCLAPGGNSVLYFVGPMYSLLVRYDKEHYPNIVGDLAESWSVSADGLTYTFKLHPNVKFHDGSILTSEDVKVSFDRLRDPPPGVISARKDELNGIVAIETPDPQTVVFRIGERNQALLSSLAYPFNCIYSASKLRADPRYPAEVVMGTGPFVPDQYAKGVSWSGKRFEGYFRPGLPYLDSYKYIVMSTGAPAINATAAGQTDGILRILSPQEIATIQQGRGDKVVVKSAILNVLTNIAFNLERKPFDDVRVRRALNLAIDRKGGLAPMSRITNQAALGALLRPGYDLAFTPDELAQLPGFGSDINASRAEARRLLAEAGQSNLKFKLLTRTQANPWLNLAVFAADQWRQVGVTAEITALDTQAAFFSRI